mgnify:CR=1 FL=1|jgi:hypothetical protein
MRNFRLPKIAYNRISLHVLCILFLSVLQPAQAQYYLVDSNHEPYSNTHQNVDYEYLSGVFTNADDDAAAESDGCINGAINMFISVAGACIGLPLIAMFALKILLGNGVRNASIQRRHAADLYLDAPQQPLRWYDPCRKSLAETVGK